MALLAAAVILLTSMQVEDETSALALQVGIDPVALQGAVATVQSTPQEYLRYEGLLEPPRLTALPGAATALWDRLAACESSAAVSRSGVYRGGLQFDQQTWLSYGGGQYAASAHLASKAQQIVVAERLRSVRGLAPWPVCGRRV
jgi:hypothetical protein